VRLRCSGEERRITWPADEMIDNTKLGGCVDKTCCPRTIQQVHHGACRIGVKIVGWPLFCFHAHSPW
jgi:hypothetical protein